MKEKLLQLGLEEKEVELYLACLASGDISPTALSRKTGIKRATVYFYLEKLQKKGLVTPDVRGARRHVSAVPPKVALKQFIRTKKERLQKEEDVLRGIISKLEKVRPEDDARQKVYTYEGQEGARFAIRKIIGKKQNVYWLGSFETLLGALSERELYRLLTVPRLKQGTVSYAITDKRILRYPQFSKMIGNKRLYRFLDKDFSTSAVLGLFADTICLLAKDGNKIRVVLIEDQLMHDVMQFLFSSLWVRL